MIKIHLRKLVGSLATRALAICTFMVPAVHASTLWIGNNTGSPVERYTSSGTFIDQWGITGATGTALDGMGFVYTVVPSGNDSVITKYDASETAVATIHFTTGTNNRHGFPSWIIDMAYRSDTHTLWVSGFNGIIYNIDLSGNKLSEFDTGHTFTGIATDGTFLYTTGGDFVDDSIVKRDLDGTIVSTFHTGVPGQGGIGIGYDASDGTLYVGYQGGLVRHFNLPGNLLGSFSTPTSGRSHDGLEVGEVGSPLTLAFPLPNRAPYTANIRSVMDHSNAERFGCHDGVIVTYTGEKGVQEHGRSRQGVKTYYPRTKNPNDFECSDQTRLYDYKNSRGMPFVVNGSYRTGSANGLYISYDGHPGYDYPVPKGTEVFAAADGTVTKTCPNDLGEIDIDHGNGLFTMYNHLSKCSVGVGDTVTKGQVIGKSGEKGASYPHLHFSVFKGYPASYKYVDPYGWDPIAGADVFVDPHTETSVCLWEVCQ